MVLLKNITYRAETCEESPFPSIFGSTPLVTKWSTPIKTLSDLDCDGPRSKCRWNNGESTVSEWRIGHNVERWNELMDVPESEKSHPSSTFLFLAVDSLSPRRYATLRSELIPCTQITTTLSMKYWLNAGTQVEVCSVDIDGVALSCAYLSEEDSPGPIEIDVDAYDQPFRFTLEMIAFDESSIGLVAISDIHVKGLLCSEEPPPIITTIDPPTILSLFGLQQGPGPNTPYPLDLNCDFSQDYCTQWINDDGLLSYGVVPVNNKKFPVPHGIEGNVAIFVLEGVKTSTLRSREVPCAFNSTLTVTYMRSEHGLVRICALDHCVDGLKTHGEISVSASSEKPFEFSIVAASRQNAVVVISAISTSGNVCTLKTAEQLVCSKIVCSFTEDLCNYDSPLQNEHDVALVPGSSGASAKIDKGKHRAILRSARLDLASPVVLNITVTQATYGSRVLICPDSTSEFDSCHELLGPRVEKPMTKSIMFHLDNEAHQFVLVLYHDKAEQFGPANFIIHSINLQHADNGEICETQNEV